MKTLCALALLFGISTAQAASWSSWSAISASGVNVPGTTNVTVVVTSPTAGSFPVTITIKDPNGNTFGTPVVDTSIFGAGQTVYEPQFTVTFPKAVVNGSYAVVVSVASAGYTQNVGTITVQGGTGTGSSAPPPVVTPPPVTTPPATYTPIPPVCWPKATVGLTGLNAPMSIGTLPAGVSTVYDSYAAWVCNFSNAYITVAGLFKSSTALYLSAFNYALGNTAASDLNGLYNSIMTTNGPYTQSEQSYVNWLIGWSRPILTVGYGASTGIYVYGLNSDGTRNTTPLANEAVAAGTRCNEYLKIQSDQGYFDVSGAPNNFTGGTPAILPAGTYAYCTIYAPNGYNNQ